MITSIELNNVRVFADRKWDFPLSKLTILCGLNSAGKSTLLRTLLLLRQSLGVGEEVRTEEGMLNFVGPYVDFGSYQSIVSHHDSNRKLEIGLTIEDTIGHQTFDLLRRLKFGTSTKQKKKSRDFVPYILKVKFEFGLKNDSEALSDDVPVLKKSEDLDREFRRNDVLLNSTYEIFDGETSLLKWNVELFHISERGRLYTLTLPKDYFEAVGGHEMMKPLPSKENVVKLAVVLEGILPGKIVGERLESDEKSLEKFTHWPLPPVPDSVIQDLKNKLSRISYIAPLRAPAERFYMASRDVGRRFDSTGRYFPHLLMERRSATVSYVRPNEQKVVRGSLIDALDEWLHYLRTGEAKHGNTNTAAGEIRVRSTHHTLVELELRSPVSHSTHALADSGFGYSQVLPILIEVLLARIGSTVVIEQPELHLNPSLQVRLSSFFVAMSTIGKQILIETHSEHLVNATRVLIAEDEIGQIAKNTSVMFLQMVENSPSLMNLAIKQDGTIADWPKEFFGESLYLTGRLLKAQKRFRKST